MKDKFDEKTIKQKFDLAGNVIIITGGTGLLGEFFACGVAEFGGFPVIVDINQSKCDSLAERIKENYKVETLGIKTDVSNKEDVERMLKLTLARFGRVDVLVNNAQHKPKETFTNRFEEYTVKQWDDVMAVNLRGLFLCTQIIGRQMIKQGKGNIINMASTYGVVSPDQRIYTNTNIGCPAVYSASKGGVIAFTKHMATYWATKNIRVNALSPHGVFANHEALFVKNFSTRSPMNRMSYKDEVVGALIFLASDASSYVTGHNLMVDGGWSIW
ncbi:MAG: SDR family oxidoreductase [Elusimicrobiota bacterium]